MQKLLDVIEDLDDVQDVYHNAEIDERAHEGPGHRRRRARARAGLEAGAVAARCRRSTSRPATAAPRSTPRLKNVAITDLAAAAPTSRWPRRSRSPWSARRRRWPPAWSTLPRPRPAHLRPDQGRRAAGKLEGLRQGLHEAPRASRPPRYETFTDAAAAHAYVDAQGRADRRQGRRPGGRQGRGGRDDARRGARRRSTSCCRTTSWACAQRRRRARRDRGVPAGEEASFIVHVRRQERRCRWPPARTTSACSTATSGPNTGGMGAYSPAPVVTPNVHARAMREIILPTIARHGSRTASPFTGFLYAGLMIDAQGQPQDARIQLPHGRPGDAADHDAAEDRPVRAC